MANKVSQIITLRKQARAKTTSKKDKVKLYPKIYKLMQQLSQREWEHPIVKSLDKFFTDTTGGKWYAKQATRPTRPIRTISSSVPTSKRLIGSPKYKLNREGPPRLVHYRGHRVSLPPRIKAKLLADLNAVGWKGDFPVTSSFRTVSGVESIWKGAARKPKFNKFINDSKIPASYKNKLKNLIYSGILKTDYGDYIAKQAGPKEHGNKHYYSKTHEDKNLPPIIWKDRGLLNKAIDKLLNERGVFVGTAAQKKAYSDDLKKVIKEVRQKFGGFGSKHLHGDKVDIYQNAFFFPGGAEILQKLQDKRNWYVHPEQFKKGKPTESNIFDIDIDGIDGKGSKIDFSKEEDYIDPVSKGLVKAHKDHRKQEKYLKGQDYQRIKQEAERLDDSGEELIEKKETIDEIPKTISQEDASAIQDHIDKTSPDIQTRPTHAAAVDTSPPLGTLDQPELQQLDEEATEEDYLPGKSPIPEVPPNEFQDFSQKEVSSLDQPTPYGVYAKGQPEFMAAEEEQIAVGADGGEVKKYFNGGMPQLTAEGGGGLPEEEKVKEEVEMGPIFPGQESVVQSAHQNLSAPGPETVTGEAPITPEQFQAQPDQPTQPTQPQQVESVDEVVLEYVQEGKTSQGRNKLIQMVKEGKTTREEISETIKKYDKPAPQEPEDIMSAHARDMGKKPGHFMQKALGLKDEEVEEIEKKKKVPVVAPQPKPDVVEESGFEKVVKSLKGEPSDTDSKKLYDPDSYAREMMEMDQKFQTDIKQALKDEAEADVELQKVEPYRFWHSMSTPAKIVSALGALVAGYALPAEGAAAAYNMINSAIDADVQSQKLDIDHAMRTRKEATRRATNTIERRAKIVGNPETRFKMMQISKNLKMNQAVKDKNDFKTRMKSRIMRNPSEAEQLFKYNPHMYQQIYNKDEIKYHRKVNTDYKKALKDNNVSNVMNAANAMENTFMDMDWKKVNGKMKLMKYDIAEPSGAGDMAMVFSFMKMLDPGSVVREGEFKTAAGMNPQYLFLARKWNKMAKGTMFTTSDRLSFVGAVNKVLKAKVQDANRVYKMYSGDLERQGYPSSFILGKPVSMSATPSMKVNKLINDIMDRKGVDREEAIKLFKTGRKIVEAQKRGVKFDKTGKPVRPKGEGKPLIGNKQFPIQSRIW